MSGEQPNLDREFIRLRQQYIGGLNNRLRVMEHAFKQLHTRSWNSNYLTDMQICAQSLAGSGGSFGYDEISHTAYALYTYLKDCLFSNSNLLDQHIETIGELLAKLTHACQQASIDSVESSDMKAVYSHPAAIALSDKPSLLILSNDAEQAQNLGKQISHFAYQFRIENCRQISSEEQLAYVSKSPYFEAIIAILDTENGDQSVERSLALVKSVLPVPRPIICVSDLDDVHTRLKAVRMGSDAFLTQPVDITQMINQLDTRTRRGKFKAYRVLIVEDCESLALAHAFFLTHANIETRVITNPLECLQEIVEFRPELILLDMYMPNYSGVELAKVIRQQNHYAGVPIVFLSAESDRNKQLDALSLGGDDVLSKPISAPQLVAAVRIRAQRYRELRSHMIKDSLTNLLNHTRSEEQLDIEIARAKREKTPLCYVMIDIDHFKAINDTHGHAAGDQVLKHFARLLTQSLRKTDIVGRYGGDEFALVLINTDSANATKVIEKIRNAFQQLQHQSRLGKFNLSFSAGIADYPRYNSAKQLHEAADRALYACKQSGRNQVRVADDSKNAA